jgi:peptide chain release factor 3
VQYRLQAEYNAESRLETAPWNILRWMQAPDNIVMPDGLAIGSGMTTAVDELGRWVVLFDSPWAQRYFEQRKPDVLLLELPE